MRRPDLSKVQRQMRSASTAESMGEQMQRHFDFVLMRGEQASVSTAETPHAEGASGSPSRWSPAKTVCPMATPSHKYSARHSGVVVPFQYPGGGGGG